MTRRLEVVLDPRGVWAEVSGYGAYDLLTEVGSRPVWAPRSGAWNVAGRYGRDVIGLAEHKNYDVIVTEATVSLDLAALEDRSTGLPVDAPVIASYDEVLW